MYERTSALQFNCSFLSPWTDPGTADCSNSFMEVQAGESVPKLLVLSSVSAFQAYAAWIPCIPFESSYTPGTHVAIAILYVADVRIL